MAILNAAAPNYAINLVRFTHWTHTRTRVFAGYRNVISQMNHE